MGRFFSERMAHCTVWAIWWLFWGGAAVWLLVGSVAYWVQKGWMPADAAGWAQALGAFVAIIVALALPYFQARKLSSDRKEEEFRRRLEAINAVFALLNHFYDLFQRLSLRCTALLLSRPFEQRHALGHELVQAAAMLREIPVTALSNEVVHFMVGLRELANYGEYAGMQIDKAVHAPQDLYDIQKRTKANAELIQRWLDELSEIEQEIRQRLRDGLK